MVHIAITRSAPHIAFLLRTIAFFILCALFVMLASPAQADTITVTNTLNEGPGSLRQAILDAASGDVVVFDPAVFGINSTIQITEQLVISKSLTILGTANKTKIVGGYSGYQGRALQVMSDNHVALANLDFSNFGKTNPGDTKGIVGGAILNSGVLTITDSSFSNNGEYHWECCGMGNSGGAVANYGMMDIGNTTFIGNDSETGGAIVNIGILNITDSKVSGNGAWGSGAIDNIGILTVTNSEINGNAAFTYVGGSAGGVGNYGTMSMFSSTVNNNGSYDGGGIYNQGIAHISNSVLRGNHASSSPRHSGLGGGILNAGQLSITDTVIADNSAPAGGGICSGGIYGTAKLSLLNVTIHGNSTYINYYGSGGSGGGLLNGGSATIVNATITNNTGQSGTWYDEPIYSDGGGISNGGNLLLINSTIYSNTAGSGGGIVNYEILILINSTIYSNTADTTADQIYNVVYDNPMYSSGVITAVNTIVGGGVIGHLNCVGPIVDGGYNIERRTSCKFTSSTSRQDTDPRLAPLAMNPTFGNDVPTMALKKGSPAIDMGNDAACPATDARGLRRPQGSHCDIGAYEVYNMRVYLPRVRR